MSGKRTIDLRVLVRAVRRRTGLDERGAGRALASVVRELGGSLTIGEAFNLAERLPPPLARECRLGVFAAGPARFSREAFVTAVAERERVGRDEARRHVVAVLEALDEQLPEERFGLAAPATRSLRREAGPSASA